MPLGFTMDSYIFHSPPLLPFCIYKCSGKRHPLLRTTVLPSPADSWRDSGSSGVEIASLLIRPVDTFPSLEGSSRSLLCRAHPSAPKIPLGFFWGRGGRHFLQSGTPVLLGHTAPYKSSVPHRPHSKAQAAPAWARTDFGEGFAARCQINCIFQGGGKRQRMVSSLFSQPSGAAELRSSPATFHPSERARWRRNRLLRSLGHAGNRLRGCPENWHSPVLWSCPAPRSRSLQTALLHSQSSEEGEEARREHTFRPIFTKLFFSLARLCLECDKGADFLWLRRNNCKVKSLLEVGKGSAHCTHRLEH